MFPPSLSKEFQLVYLSVLCILHSAKEKVKFGQRRRKDWVTMLCSRVQLGSGVRAHAVILTSLDLCILNMCQPLC